MIEDDELQKLREIGERNRVTLSLLRNWCEHAEVVSESSGGLFQEMTGLPIAMSRVTCRHERAMGSISMHLDQNALSFHDRNCIDCDRRIPVGFPNLSHLIGERDRGRAQESQAADDRRRAESDLLAERVAARGQVFAKPTPAQISLLALLDRLDRVPSEETERDFVSGMRAVGGIANDSFGKAVIGVIRAGGLHRMRGGLLALEAIGYDSVSIGALALDALARNEAVDIASDLAIRHMAPCHRDQIRKAGPAFLLLARIPTRSMLEGEVVSRPEALAAAYRMEPAVIQEAIECALARNSKKWRQAGCFATMTLIQEEIDFDFIAVSKALVDSFHLPDDVYFPGPAYGAVARVLAELLRRFQEPVEAILIACEEDRDHRVRTGVFRAYTEIFRRRIPRTGEMVTERPMGELRSAAVESRVFGRIVAIVSVLADDERLMLAIDFMRGADQWITGLEPAAAAAPVLLGIVAVACERSEAARRGSSIIMDPRPEPLRELDLGGRALHLSNLASEVLCLVTKLARKHPTSPLGLSSFGCFWRLSGLCLGMRIALRRRLSSNSENFTSIDLCEMLSYPRSTQR